MLDRIEAALREFQAGTAIDDRAMLVLRFTGEQHRPAGRAGRLAHDRVRVGAGAAPRRAALTPARRDARGRRLLPDAAQAHARPAAPRDGRPRPRQGKGQAGRFPILKRLCATAVVPREEGIEGWLWTTTGGSALTVLGDEDAAPTGALLFTKPLRPGAARGGDEPEAFEALAARSPLGVPAVPGLLFRVAEPTNAETAFRSYGLLRPLTDREVPPTMRRSLPTDKSADPTLASGPAHGPRAPWPRPGF